MNHRNYIAIAALATTLSCTGDGPGDTSGTDTSVPVAPPRAPWFSTGHQGHLHYIEQRQSNRRTMMAVFGDNFGDVLWPASCLYFEGAGCLSALPEGDAPVSVGDVSIPASAVYDWVGDFIQIGTADIPFTSSGGVAGYVASGGGTLPAEGVDLFFGGQWDRATLPGSVVPVPPLNVTSPSGSYVSLRGADAIPLRWEAAPTDDTTLLLEVRVGANRYVTSLDDDGEHDVPATLFADLPPTTTGNLSLRRVRDTTIDVGENRLRVTTETSFSTLVADAELRSCAEILAGSPSVQSGVYPIQPIVTEPARDVYCDMTTDEGGWTLVGASINPLTDERGDYHLGLATLEPPNIAAGIWHGLRDVIAPSHDVRFTCRNGSDSGPMTVDLSFYDVAWYRTVTTGTDNQSCFEVRNSPTIPAAGRRNNLTNATRAAGVTHANGDLVGEDSCGDVGDFTVDFDDRGMDSNQSDGTDWGLDDGAWKCGQSGISSGTWFFWVR